MNIMKLVIVGCIAGLLWSSGPWCIIWYQPQITVQIVRSLYWIRIYIVFTVWWFSCKLFVFASCCTSIGGCDWMDNEVDGYVNRWIICYLWWEIHSFCFEICEMKIHVMNKTKMKVQIVQLILQSQILADGFGNKHGKIRE